MRHASPSRTNSCGARYGADALAVAVADALAGADVIALAGGVVVSTVVSGPVVSGGVASPSQVKLAVS